MMSAWWLLLLLPLAGSFGYMIAALMWVADERKGERK